MRKVFIFIFSAIFLATAWMTVGHFYNDYLMEAESIRARYVALNTVEADVNGVCFAALHDVFSNSDIVAHLLVPGTSIDYYVVQGYDNEFYLTHNIWREPVASGWVFLDYRVDLSGDDHNWVIYGHNMQRDHKFHSLRRFAAREFFETHPVIILTTPQNVYTWEIFSFYSTHVDFGYNAVNFSDRQEMLSRFIALSRHDAGVSVSSDDRILTLSTCTNRNDDERYVLHARLSATA